MNKFPAWLNLLVLIVVLAGVLFALPNIYGSANAVQIASDDGVPITESGLERYVRTVELRRMHH